MEETGYPKHYLQVIINRTAGDVSITSNIEDEAELVKKLNVFLAATNIISIQNAKSQSKRDPAIQ